MKQAGYTLTEMNRAGYTLAEMNRAGYVEGLKLAGYTIAEAKQALGTPTAAPPARARTPPSAGNEASFLDLSFVGKVYLWREGLRTCN